MIAAADRVIELRLGSSKHGGRIGVERHEMAPKLSVDGVTSPPSTATVCRAAPT
jgi:hypothetical protein